MTALGGAVADGFLLSYVHKGLLGSHARALRAACGDRPFHISYSTMIVTTDAQFEEARAQLTFRLVDSPPEVKQLVGISESDVAKIRSALAEGGPRHAARHVRPEWVSPFVISGTVGDCAAEIAELLSINEIDEFLLSVLEVDGGAALIERAAAMFTGRT